MKKRHSAEQIVAKLRQADVGSHAKSAQEQPFRESPIDSSLHLRSHVTVCRTDMR